ncbi:MAG: hypothetical protein NZV14_15800 [Bryobacteraceae bacterium]|nr:hypothetical protein [Bryobacteraceae bacterium]MDW8379624.1 hypothetical protein [Bryobacterales bacterium]
MRWLGFLLLPALMWSHSETLEKNRAVIRRAAELLQKDDANLDKFYFLQRKETKQLDSEGQVKARTVVTTRREAFDGVPVVRVVARDDRPISAEEQKRQEEVLRQKVLQYRTREAQEKLNPTGSSARKRQDWEGEAMIREFPEALDYHFVGNQVRRSRETLVFDFSPRPGYKPKSVKMKFFEKMQGRVWIDKLSNELLAAEAEIFETVNIGFGVVATMRKGTRFRLERQEAAPGLWVTDNFYVRFAARFMLVKSFFQEIESKLTNFELRPQAVATASRATLSSTER